MLNSNDGGSHPCLVPALKGKAYNVSPQNMIAVGFLQGESLYFFHSLFGESFIPHDACFYQMLSLQLFR